jgi:pimeloyl-ACP methyl ester carboxylesterase
MTTTPERTEGTTDGTNSVTLSQVPLPEVDPTTPQWPGRFFDLGELKLHARVTPGPGDGAPDALYVHGLGGSSSNWTDLAAQLSGEVNGYALDLPGFGRSEPPHGWPFTPQAQADIVIRFIEHLGGAPVQLFGNSLGGLTAVLVAARRPDLVRSLTLISPAMPDLRPDPRRLSDPRMALIYVPLLGKRVRRELANATDRQRAMQIIELCFANPSAVPEHRIAEAERENAERATMAWAAAALDGASLGLFRTWARFGRRSVWRLLPRIPTPTLVVWGQKDRLVTVRKAPRTAYSLARGKLMVLANAGHVAQMEEPQKVARAVLGMWESVAAGTW